MSSHHIVREKQEPALLILSLEGFEEETLGQILEWSPTVIVQQEIYESADSLGFKIDIIIGAAPNFKIQENTRFIPIDTHPIEDTLKFLIAEQYDAVNVIASEFVLKDYALFVNEIDIVVFTATQKIFPVQDGFKKWQPAGEKVQLLQSVSNLRTSGLVALEPTIFKTEKDGFYSLNFEDTFIFIAESI